MGLRFKAATITNARQFANDFRNEPGFDGYAVTPADGTDLPNGTTTAIYVTGAGNVNVDLAGGGTAVLTSLVAGQILPIAVNRIRSTSTTATGIFALYA